MPGYASSCRICSPPIIDQVGADIPDDESDNEDDEFNFGVNNHSKPCKELLYQMEKQWSERNSKVIMYLSQALDRPQELVSNYLYNLTFENFGRSLNPRGSCSCQVPLVDCCTCDLYLGIFDENGDLCNPIRRYCLRKLIQVLRTALEIKIPTHIERVDLFSAIGMKRTKKLKNTKRNLEKQCCYASCSPVVNRKRGLRNLYNTDGKFNAYELSYITQSGLNSLGYNFTEPKEIGLARGACDPADNDTKEEEETVEIDFEKIRKLRASRFKRKTFDKEPIQLDPLLEEDIVLDEAEEDEDILPYRHIISKYKFEDTKLPQVGEPEMVVLLPTQQKLAT